MDAETVREFIRSNHRAVLATQRSDGGMQLSPVLVGVDDDGSLLISTRETAVKARNLRRQPRAYLCSMGDAFFGPWYAAEGEVIVESLPGAMEALVRHYRQVAGEHSDWDDYRAAMVRERRVMLRLRIDRVGPTVSG